jgi:outer membrane protein OmpA-like peptidoglycan-associated protein
MNLGATINTAGREMFPTVIDSTLYFASDGHYGFGGLDIYQSDIKSKKEYSIPQNLGEPVNSNMDDFSYTFNPETMTGYISSNRAGGKGDDDIYFFTKLDPIIEQTYSGYVFDERTGEPLAEADVILKDVFDVPVVEFSTDETGFYKFTLAPNSQYAVSATKPNYNKKVLEFATDNERDKVMENNNIYLTNFEALTINDDGVEKIDVEPIYFDYDKYAITPQAEVELNKVLFAMTEFPEIKIKIESHTDSRGSDSYNLKLSDNRAKSTRDYLISKGIDKSRIESAIGYGETQLKNNCSNGVNCTADEHAVNRRSDFIIISK